MDVVLLFLSASAVIYCQSDAFPLSDLLGHEGYIPPERPDGHKKGPLRTPPFTDHNVIATYAVTTETESAQRPATETLHLPTSKSPANGLNFAISNIPHSKQRGYSLFLENYKSPGSSVVNFLMKIEDEAIQTRGTSKWHMPSNTAKEMSYARLRNIFKRDAHDDDDDDDHDDHHSSHLLNHILAQVRAGHANGDNIAHWMSIIQHALHRGSITQAQVDRFLQQLKGTELGQQLGDKCCYFG